VTYVGFKGASSLSLPDVVGRAVLAKIQVRKMSS
jgi:hypothetical protein